MNKLQRKGLVAACTLAATLASGYASAAPVFQVNEGVVPGAAANTVTADRMTFGYQATINQTIVGPFDGVGDTFTETGFLNKASYENGAGNAVPSQLNSLPGAGYGIYGIFSIEGTAMNAGGQINATFATANLTLYVDPLQNTLLNLTCILGPFGSCAGQNDAPGGGDDQALATYTLRQGEAHVFAGLANGDFDTLLDMTLTPYGKTFFVDPNPFFPIENFGGNTQNIQDTANLTTSFTALADGAGVELFRVPEPASLSLVGLALLGLGASRRRRTTRA